MCLGLDFILNPQIKIVQYQFNHLVIYKLYYPINIFQRLLYQINLLISIFGPRRIYCHFPLIYTSFGGIGLYLIYKYLVMNRKKRVTFEESILNSLQEKQVSPLFHPPEQKRLQQQLFSLVSPFHNEELLTQATRLTDEKECTQKMEYKFTKNEEIRQQVDLRQQQFQGVDDEPSTKQKKKLAKLVLNLIFKNNPISRQHLFRLYSHQSQNSKLRKGKKRRFDQILKVLKEARIVTEKAKIFRVLDKKEELRKIKEQIFPQEMKAHLQRKELALQQLRKREKQLQLIKQHTSNNQILKVPLRRKIKFPILMLNSDKPLQGQNCYNNNQKKNIEEHMISLKGRFEAYSELDLLSLLYPTTGKNDEILKNDFH